MYNDKEHNKNADEQIILAPLTGIEANFKPFYSVIFDDKSFGYVPVLFYKPGQGLIDKPFPKEEDAIELSKRLAKQNKKLFLDRVGGFVTIATLGIITDKSYIAVYICITGDATIVSERADILENSRPIGLKYAKDKDLVFMDYFGFKL